jgi:hypothetical protein
MTSTPTFPLSQVWNLETGIHGDDLLFRFDRVAEYAGLNGGIFPSSEQRLSESIFQSPYQKYLGDLDVTINNNWVGDPVGMENRRLPDSNSATNSDRVSSGFGSKDTMSQLADLAINKLPPGIKNFAQMVEPELRNLIPVETIAAIDKGREIYEVAQQISSDWQKLATVNHTLPFDKIAETINIPGLARVSNFINSSIFGGKTKVETNTNSQIGWYLNPTFSSAYQSTDQNIGANDLARGDLA